MIKIYKTITVPIKCSKRDMDYLFKCNKEAAKIWNECNRIYNEFRKVKQIYVDQNYFQQVFKSGYGEFLTVKSMQLISKKYLSCINAIIKARKVGRTDLRYPYKTKKNFNTLWDYQTIKIDRERNIILLSKPKIYIDGKYKNQQPIKLHIKNIPQNVLIVEVKYDKGLKLAINFFVEEEKQNNKGNNTCAVDMGEIHAITVVDQEGNREIITGRLIRSIQRFRNKELGKLQSKISKCKKGSRNYKKYRKAIQKLLSKSNQKTSDSIHKVSKIFIDYLVDNNIHTIIIGDLSKFNMNLKNEKRKKGSKQRLAQWPHGKLKEKIQEKIKPLGINLVEISERYTSQTCPNCLNRHKPKGRNYVCECGFKEHRDVVGAINILSSYLNNGEIKSLNLPDKPLKYLRIA